MGMLNAKSHQAPAYNIKAKEGRTRIGVMIGPITVVLGKMGCSLAPSDTPQAPWARAVSWPSEPLLAVGLEPDHAVSPFPDS